MEDNVFWLRIMQSFIALLAVVTLTIGGCTAYETSLVADAVKKGSDPIAARCGIVGDSGNPQKPMCVLSASKSK